MNLIASDADSKFRDPRITADGSTRASVDLRDLTTLWINTGTLCNLACENCYIESSPANDRLAYITRAEVAAYFDEIRTLALPVREIGITGGEPFMNPDLLPIMDDALAAGLHVLVLTNAMRPMMKCAAPLLALRDRYPAGLTVRVSIDHPERARHEEERGLRSWQPTIDGLRWLAQHDFQLHVAGRTRWGESESDLRAGFARLFADNEIPVNASDPGELILFPEMDATADVPEITTECWNLLGVDPASLMCASSRMVVKHKGAAAPEVVACTLLPYADGFSFGSRLADSLEPIALNHRHCAKFCVLGGGSCSG